MTDQSLREQVFQGIAAAPGIAIGPAYVYRKLTPEIHAHEVSPEEIPGEIDRLQKAIQRSTKELQKILVFAEQKLGSDSARIFEAQTMILGDAVLIGEIERRIAAEGRNAEYIVADEIAKYKRLMLASELEYMHERAHDLDDVVNRIVRNIRDQRLFSRWRESRSLFPKRSPPPTRWSSAATRSWATPLTWGASPPTPPSSPAH